MSTKKSATTTSPAATPTDGACAVGAGDAVNVGKASSERRIRGEFGGQQHSIVLMFA